MADLDISLAVDPGDLGPTLAQTARSTRDLTEATEGQGRAEDRAAAASQALLEAERRRIAMAGAAIRAIKERAEELKRYAAALQAAQATENRTSGAGGADPRRRAAADAARNAERLLREEIARTNATAANVAGLQQRNKAMADMVAAAQRGAEAQRQLAEAQQLAAEVSATGAAPGSAAAADAERALVVYRQLRTELAAIEAARERDNDAARESAALAARVDRAAADLEAENRALVAAANARRQGAAAIRAYNEQQAVSNALQRAGAVAGTAQAERIERLARENAKLRRETDELTAAQHRQTSSTNLLRNAFFALQAVLLTLGIGQLIRDSVRLVVEMEGASRTFGVITGSAGAARQELAFVRAEADRLGLAFGSTAVQFSQFLAASKGSLTLSQAREVFVSVTEALANLGRGEQQTERALLALQQMASKGTVSMEELRQQLGDALPQALQLAAKAMGLPLSQFIKMVEQGKILSKDLLPKLAVEIRNAFGNGGAQIENTQAKLNRFKNAVDDLRRSFGEGFLSGLLEGFSTLQKTMSSAEIQQAARDLGETLGTALRRAAEAAAFLARNLEYLKAVLVAILALRAGAWFVALAGAIATATGRTIAFRAAASNLVLAGGLAGVGIALSALIVVMNKYIATSKLAHETEMGRVARAQELFGYYNELKANKKGLTEAEWAYANQVLKTMVAERAALEVSLARTRAQLEAAQTRNPFKYQAVAGPGRNALAEQAKEQERELKTIQNQILILDSQWQRLGDLPVIKLPVDDSAVDKAGKKIADLLETFRRAAEQAERIRNANLQGATEALAVTEAIERENAAYGALNSIEGLSAESKKRLTAIIIGLVGRTQDADRATAALIAARERDLAFATAAREVEARLADARANDTAASRALAVALEAEGVARDEGREKDAEYIKFLTAVIGIRHEYIATLDSEARAIQRGNEWKTELTTLQARLADAETRSTAATRENAIALEVERLRIEDGISARDPLMAALRREVEERAAVRSSIEAQILAAERLQEAESRRQAVQAGLADWEGQRAAVRAYGSEIAGILEQYGLLSRATDELAIRETVLARAREEGIELTRNGQTAATTAGFIRLIQIEGEVRAVHEAEEAVRSYQARVVLQEHILEPLRAGWQQIGQTIQSAMIDKIVEGTLSLEDLWKQLLRIALNAIAQMLARWIAAQRLMQAEAARTGAVNAASAQAGGGGGGGGWGSLLSLFGGGASAGSGAGAGAVGAGGAYDATGLTWGASGGGGASVSSVGTYAGYAFIAFVALMIIYKSFIDKGTQWAEVNLRTGARTGNSGKVKNQVQGRVDQILKELDQFTKLLDIDIVELGDVWLGKRNGIYYVRDAFSQVGAAFRSAEEAMEYAKVQAIRLAEFADTVSLLVREAARGSRATTTDQLADDIRWAQSLETRGLAEVTTRVREIFENFTTEMARAADLFRNSSAALRQALIEITRVPVEALASIRDQIIGKKINPEEQQLRDMELFNAELRLRRSSIELRLVEIRAQIAWMRAVLAGTQATVGGALAIARGMQFTSAVTRAQLEALEVQEAALADLLARLPAEIDPNELVRPGRGGGGGGPSAEDRATFVRELERAGWTDLRRSIAATRDAFADAGHRIHELGFRGEEAARLLELAAAEMRRQIALIRQDQIDRSRDFISRGTAAGGDVMGGLTEVDRTMRDLIRGNRDLFHEGVLNRREMRDLNRQIREAADRQRHQLVADATGGLLLDLYQLLGDEKAAAQLRYDLTVAELMIRREELVLAYQRLHLEFTALGAIDELIAKVIAAGPGLFLGGGGDQGAADRLAEQQRQREELNRSAGEAFAQAVRDFRSAIEDLVRSTRELLTNEQLSPLNPAQRLQAAVEDYQQTLAAARGGDLEALRRYDEVRRNLLGIAQTFYAGGADMGRLNPGYMALFQQILADAATIATPEVEQRTAQQALLELVQGQQAGQAQQHEDLEALRLQLQEIAANTGGRVIAASTRFAVAGDDRPAGSPATPTSRAEALLEQAVRELQGLRRDEAVRGEEAKGAATKDSLRAMLKS